MQLDELFRRGVELLNQNKLCDAEKCFREVLAGHGDWAEARHFLGVCLRRSGRVKEAVVEYREALRLRPRWADARNNLGLALRSLGELNAALPEFRLAVAARPEHAEARNNLGVTLADLGVLPEAAASYRLSLRYNPNSPDTHNNLGVVLVQMGRRAEGVKHYRRALALAPNYAEAHNNLGNALKHEGKFAEAEASLREALRLKPGYAEAYNNLAIILVKQERMDEAISHYHEALRLKADYPEAHKNLGLALLGKGDLRAGWPEYEYRWKTKEMPARKFAQPAWDGGPLAGKTILLYAEQGLGDTIQFIRYAAVVAAGGATVVVECQKALLGLFGRCPWIDRLVAQGEKLPDFDTHAALMSVPGIVGTTLENIPFHQPGYLSADPERVRKWGEELAGIGGFKIGIVWQGSKGFQDDFFRSAPLAAFEPLTRVAGVRLVSLQKGYGAEQLRKVRGWKVHDVGNRLDDFLDTAAVMQHLDLVISVDTSVAHLAGALGVPVWVALPTAPDWRWLQEREDTPWYPSMRLFRQKKSREWGEVFERMARALEAQPRLESAERYGQRGLAALREGKLAEAAALLERAVELEPTNAILHNNLAVARDRAGDKAAATLGFAEAVRLSPAYGDALHNLGNMLRHAQRPADAEAIYRRALKALPESADLCNHLGIALLAQAKHAEAEASLQRALRLNPQHAEAHNNLGVLFERQRRIDEATACYVESLRHKPESVDTHKNLALTWLLCGDFARGWPEYEWRWKSQPARFAQPRWDGRPLTGEVVLLTAEQGLGDTIQFVRFARMVKERGGTVHVECPGELVTLLARCPGIDWVIPQGAALGDFAYHLPMMSAPLAFGTTLETVPASVPYLSAELERIERWREVVASTLRQAASLPATSPNSVVLPSLNGHAVHLPLLTGQAGGLPYGPLTIGIAWQGSRRYAGDGHRSAPLAAFAPLAKIPGVQLVSLQKGYGAEQLSEVPDWHVLDLGDRLTDFADTAAVMMQLDLVICVDTAVGHLAGALGIETWLALSVASDWRWLRQGDDSPWYPTHRLFRQTQWGDWGSVFERMADVVRQRMGAAPRPIAISITPGALLDRIANLETQCARVRKGSNVDGIRRELGGLLAARARGMRRPAGLESSQRRYRGSQAIRPAPAEADARRRGIAGGRRGR